MVIFLHQFFLTQHVQEIGLFKYGWLGQGIFFWDSAFDPQMNFHEPFELAHVLVHNPHPLPQYR